MTLIGIAVVSVATSWATVMLCVTNYVCSLASL